jgi:flagellar basal body-associated protein FliL
MKKVGKVILRVFVVVAAVAGTIAGLFFFKKKRKIRKTEDIETDDTQTDDIQTDDNETDDASNSKAD